MQHNIGNMDRVVRLLGGVLFLLVGWFVFQNWIARGIVLVLGAIAVIESLTGYCGLYKLLGISTAQRDKRRLWQVLAWLFVLCGLLAYGWGWTALLNGTTYWFPTEFWFYDAIATGVFAVFFFLHAAKQNGKK